MVPKTFMAPERITDDLDDKCKWYKRDNWVHVCFIHKWLDLDVNLTLHQHRQKTFFIVLRNSDCMSEHRTDNCFDVIPRTVSLEAHFRRTKKKTVVMCPINFSLFDYRLCVNYGDRQKFRKFFSLVPATYMYSEAPKKTGIRYVKIAE